MVKYQGFRVKTVNFGTKTYDLTHESESSGNMFTVILGKNGCGKSRILKQISTSFAVSDQLLRETPERWTSICEDCRLPVTPESFNYSINDYDINVGTIHRDIAGVFSSSHVSSNYKDCFPAELICLSTSPFDRFPEENKVPLNRNDKEFGASYPSIYTYIGLKNGGKYLSVSSLINKVIHSLLCDPQRVSMNFKIISNTLSFLGYGNRFRFSLSNTLVDDNLFDIHDEFHLKKAFIRRIRINYSEMDYDDSYNLISNEDLKEVMKCICIVNKRFNQKWDKNITATIKLDDTSDDFDFLQAVSVLIKFDICKVAGFKLSQKDDNRKFIVFSDASSGEQCLTLMLLGIAGKIRDNSLICIDEPEISLHPEWQNKFIALLESIYSRFRGCHFIIATHSPHIISNLEGNNSFILNMDENTLYTSNGYQDKSADYQLAKLFGTPGKHNEYINRICVKLLCKLSKNAMLDEDEKLDFDFLLSIRGDLESNDSSIELIDILVDAVEILKVKNESNNI